MTFILPAKTLSDMHEEDPAHALSSASGFKNLLGYRVVHWELGLVQLELDIEPKHLNRSGSVHGGMLATLIDAASALSGLYCVTPGNIRRAMTLSLNTSFTGRATSGVLLAQGKLRRAGRQIFFAETEITDLDGQIIAFGNAVNRYEKGSENVEGIYFKATS